jgi:PPOX class probable F420-dependent enzyme
MGQLTMNKAEREEFLAGVHIGVLSVSRPGGAAPVVTPIWYGYEPGGEIVIVTGRQAEKTRLARDHGEASLCVQTEELPYRYVVVSGPAVVEDSADEDVRRALAHRYMGAELGDAYIAATEGESAGAVTLRIRPERWHTTDYSKTPPPG